MSIAKCGGGRVPQGAGAAPPPVQQAGARPAAGARARRDARDRQGPKSRRGNTHVLKRRPKGAGKPRTRPCRSRKVRHDAQQQNRPDISANIDTRSSGMLTKNKYWGADTLGNVDSQVRRGKGAARRWRHRPSSAAAGWCKAGSRCKGQA